MFSLAVTTPGYADWSVTGVTVTANSCRIPQGVTLLAKLQR